MSASKGGLLANDEIKGGSNVESCADIATLVLTWAV
jgi:hypothetical protein